MLPINYIDHIALNVTNLERSIRWYADIFGMERRHEEFTGENLAMMFGGGSYLALFQLPAGERHDAPRQQGLSLLHFGFRVDREVLDRAAAELHLKGITTRLVEREVSTALYFHDPDGYELELSVYEPWKAP